MRKLLFLLIILNLYSCEDVIEVDAPAEDPRLIFDAVLRVNPDSPNENRIHISTTNSFFGSVNPSLLDRIQLQSELGGFPLFYAPDPDVFGDYIPGADNVPNYENLLLDSEFDTESRMFLTFEYNEELYLAIATYTKVPELTSVSQGTGNLLDEDDTEIIVSFTDPEDEENYYAVGFGNGEYVVLEDKFFNGQEFNFSYFSSQDLEPNDELLVTLWGIEKPFYDYMRQLIDQSENGDNLFFQSPVSTVRGNILKAEGISSFGTDNNVGRPQEFVLGYFAIVQESSKILTF